MTRLFLKFRVRYFLRNGKLDRANNLVSQLIHDEFENYTLLLEIAIDFYLQVSPEAMNVVVEILKYIYANATGDIFNRVTFSLGLYNFNAYNFSEADKYFAQLIHLNNPRTFSYLISSAISQKNFKLAEKYFSQANDFWEFNPDIVYQKARMYDLLGKKGEIRKVYTEYLSAAPELVASNFYMGEFLSIYTKDYLAAKKKYEDALALIKTDPFLGKYDSYLHTQGLVQTLNWTYANILLDLQENDHAEELAKNVFDKETYLWWWSGYFIRTKQYAKALENLKIVHKSARNIRNRHLYQSYMGKVYLLQEDFQNAEAMILESIRIGDSLWEPYIDDYIHMSVCLDIQSRTGGNKFCEIASQLDARPALFSRISILFTLGLWEKTIRAGLEHRKNYGFTQEVTYFLANAYKEMGSYNEAKKEYLKLSKLEPRNFFLLLELAEVYELLEDLTNVGMVKTMILSLEDLPTIVIEQVGELCA
jgi:tetratricopeptide (TPR) repeat protein